MDTMRYRQLGQSDIKVSEVSLGFRMMEYRIGDGVSLLAEWGWSYPRKAPAGLDIASEYRQIRTE
jgi:aryl-alcohol dehydrogenase-like predicted oxidoreductase